MHLRKVLQAAAVAILLPFGAGAADWTELVFPSLNDCLPEPQKLFIDGETRKFVTEGIAVDIRKYLDVKKAKVSNECKKREDTSATFETRGTFYGNKYRSVKIPLGGHCDCFTCGLYMIEFENDAETVRSSIFAKTGVRLKIAPDEEVDVMPEPGLDENGEDPVRRLAGHILRQGNKSSFVCDLTW